MPRGREGEMDPKKAKYEIFVVSQQTTDPWLNANGLSNMRLLLNRF